MEPYRCYCFTFSLPMANNLENIHFYSWQKMNFVAAIHWKNENSKEKSASEKSSTNTYSLTKKLRIFIKQQGKKCVYPKWDVEAFFPLFFVTLLSIRVVNFYILLSHSRSFIICFLRHRCSAN